jgi:hypothetical protein
LGPRKPCIWCMRAYMQFGDDVPGASSRSISGTASAAACDLSTAAARCPIISRIIPRNSEHSCVERLHGGFKSALDKRQKDARAPRCWPLLTTRAARCWPLLTRDNKSSKMSGRHCVPWAPGRRISSPASPSTQHACDTRMRTQQCTQTNTHSRTEPVPIR